MKNLILLLLLVLIGSCVIACFQSQNIKLFALSSGTMCVATVLFLLITKTSKP